MLTSRRSLWMHLPASRISPNEEVVLQFHQPDGDLKAEYLLPDPASQTPEEIYANEEMVAQLDIGAARSWTRRTGKRSYFSRWKASPSKRLAGFLTGRLTTCVNRSITPGSECKKACRSAMSSGGVCSSARASRDPAHSWARAPFSIIRMPVIKMPVIVMPVIKLPVIRI